MSSILWRCHRFSTSTEQWISRLCEEILIFLFLLLLFLRWKFLRLFVLLFWCRRWRKLWWKSLEFRSRTVWWWASAPWSQSLIFLFLLLLFLRWKFLRVFLLLFWCRRWMKDRWMYARMFLVFLLPWNRPLTFEFLVVLLETGFSNALWIPLVL